jgi:hypothetical protein
MDPLVWILIGLLVALVFACIMLMVVESYLKNRAAQGDLLHGGAARRGRGELLAT